MDKLYGTDGIAITGQLENVTVPWTIEIYGHIPKTGSSGTPQRGDASQNGIKLASQTQDCQMNPGTSVLLTAINPPYGAIYPVDLPKSGKRHGNKRFLDKSDNCKTGPPLADGTGDQDFCERMAKAVITTPAKTYTLTCPDGDCEIEVGQPQP